MRWLEKILEPARSWFERLNPREQAIVAGGGAVVSVLILLIIGVVLAGSIGGVENRIAAKTQKLAEVVRLEGDYKARESERRSRLRELERNNVRLVSVVEDAARLAGFEIGQIRPETSPPNEEGFVESTVDLQASGLSINRLESFLTKIEQTPGVITVQRLEIKKPYRKDTLDIEMTVATYQKKS